MELGNVRFAIDAAVRFLVQREHGRLLVGYVLVTWQAEEVRRVTGCEGRVEVERSGAGRPRTSTCPSDRRLPSTLLDELCFL